MKSIKYIIIAIAVIAGGIGIYYLATRESVDDEIVVKPSTKQEKYIAKEIEDKITNCADSKFCVNERKQILKDIKLLLGTQETNKKTYTNLLERAYRDKFIKQADYVFSHNQWKANDIKIIKAENKRLKDIYTGNQQLDDIQSVLNQYNKLLTFNQRVRNACGQQPKCLSNPEYFYKCDDWNKQETSSILNSIPSVSGKVTNSPVYAMTTEANVRERLKAAHKKFINDKLDASEKEAKSWNYDPSRKSDYNKMASTFRYDCLQTYADLWTAGSEVTGWQRRIRDLEQYANEE